MMSGLPESCVIRDWPQEEHLLFSDCCPEVLATRALDTAQVTTLSRRFQSTTIAPQQTAGSFGSDQYHCQRSIA